jgi:hypothetical protein
VGAGFPVIMMTNSKIDSGDGYTALNILQAIELFTLPKRIVY